jgi:hypothetical protein
MTDEWTNSRLMRAANVTQNTLPTKHSPPISLYIFTDGKFGPEAREFATPVRSLIRQLISTQDILPGFVSITLIQFGDDPHGETVLRLIQHGVSNLEELSPS